MRCLYARHAKWPAVHAVVAAGLADAFDTARGTFFSVLLFALLIAGAVVLLVNLTSNRPVAPQAGSGAAPAQPPPTRVEWPPPGPAFEPLPDEPSSDESRPAKAAAKKRAPAKRAPQRRTK